MIGTDNGLILNSKFLFSKKNNEEIILDADEVSSSAQEAEAAQSNF